MATDFLQDGVENVPWLKLASIKGSLAKQVWRLSTVGGAQPEGPCKDGDQVERPYAAMYCAPFIIHLHLLIGYCRVLRLNVEISTDLENLEVDSAIVSVFLEFLVVVRKLQDSCLSQSSLRHSNKLPRSSTNSDWYLSFFICSPAITSCSKRCLSTRHPHVPVRFDQAVSLPRSSSGMAAFIIFPKKHSSKPNRSNSSIILRCLF